MVLARLAGSGCADAATRLRGSSHDDRAGFLAQVLAAARRAIPYGLERIHPEWLERALGGVSRTMVDAIVEMRGESSPDDAIPAPTRLWLRHHVFATLVAMPTGPCPSPRAMSIGDLPGLPHPALHRVLGRIGATQLAWALHGAGASAMTRAAQAFGESGRAVLAAASDVTRWIAQGRDPAAFHGPARDAQSRIAGLLDRRTAGQIDDPIDGPIDVTLFRIGCRALAPRIVEHGGDLDRQIAQRMPHASGVLALAEWTGAHGRVSPGRSVAWSAVVECIARCTSE